VAEWPNVPDSKSGVPQGTVGSNPTLSAKNMFSTVHDGIKKHPRSPCSPAEQGLFLESFNTGYRKPQYFWDIAEECISTAAWQVDTSEYFSP
jgi:hypothetical protein